MYIYTHMCNTPYITYNVLKCMLTLQFAKKLQLNNLFFFNHREGVKIL